MASILKWTTVTFVAGDGPVTITATGNVDTRVATRYFWLPVSDTNAAAMWDRKDGELLKFDTNLIGAGQNHLGFVFQVAPVVRKETNLLVMFQVRQGNRILLEQNYPLTTSGPDEPVQLADGITVAI